MECCGGVGAGSGDGGEGGVPDEREGDLEGGAMCGSACEEGKACTSGSETPIVSGMVDEDSAIIFICAISVEGGSAEVRIGLIAAETSSSRETRARRVGPRDGTGESRWRRGDGVCDTV